MNISIFSTSFQRKSSHSFYGCYGRYGFTIRKQHSSKVPSIYYVSTCRDEGYTHNISFRPLGCAKFSENNLKLDRKSNYGFFSQIFGRNASSSEKPSFYYNLLNQNHLLAHKLLKLRFSAKATKF